MKESKLDEIRLSDEWSSPFIKATFPLSIIACTVLNRVRPKMKVDISVLFHLPLRAKWNVDLIMNHQ